MDRAILFDVLKTYDVALRENGATGLYVFGSRAYGTERPDSDLDLFIDYNGDGSQHVPPDANRGRNFGSSRHPRHHHDAERFAPVNEEQH